MGKFIKLSGWSFTALAGVVALGLQVPPDQAASNAALWVEAFTGYLPDWPVQTDRWLTVGAVLVALIPVGFWFWNWVRSRSSQEVNAVRPLLLTFQPRPLWIHHRQTEGGNRPWDAYRLRLEPFSGAKDVRAHLISIRKRRGDEWSAPLNGPNNIQLGFPGNYRDQFEPKSGASAEWLILLDYDSQEDRLFVHADGTRSPEIVRPWSRDFRGEHGLPGLEIGEYELVVLLETANHGVTRTRIHLRWEGFRGGVHIELCPGTG